MLTCVILSGGVGTRFTNSQNIPKQYLCIREKPFIVWVLKQYQENAKIDRILVVADPLWYEFLDEWIEKEGITKFAGYAESGRFRQESVLHGMQQAASFMDDNDLIIFQDAARPLVTDEMINGCIDACAESDGAVVSACPTEAYCYYDKDGKIASFLDYTCMAAIQSPDCYRFGKYYALNLSASEDELRASRGCMYLAVRNGLTVTLVPGGEVNPKLTLPDDYEYIQMLFQRYSNE